MTEIKKPKTSNSESAKEIEKLKDQFDSFDENVKSLTLDRLNQAPKQDVEPQTKISQKDLEKSRDIYLKPTKWIASQEKFNERFRDDFNFKKEYVRFVAENKEVIGETIEMWTKPFPGCAAEFWQVPVNKPINAPRYLAEQIKTASYHRLTMDEQTPVSQDLQATYCGRMVSDTLIQRLDALPVSSNKSIFMGAGNF